MTEEETVTVTLYKYNLEYDGGWLCECTGFYDEDEAEDGVKNEMESRMEYWISNDIKEGRESNYDMDLFQYDIEEYEDEVDADVYNMSTLY